ncbi:MAG: glycoside hydrolase family 3 N-terminal domain-containing protein, partial [Polymorphobacter sp.]
PILIDQEGGRVARLRGPHWPAFPAAAVFGERYQSAPITAITAARCNAEALALLLGDLGITVACLPVLDVRQADGDAIIGDRSYGGAPLAVAVLGRATLDGLRDGGVAGVVKHLPGHGRATVDSHLALPVVQASREALAADFAPFRALHAAPMGMVAHIVYTAFDADACASCSAAVIDTVIRGEIGFGGLLLSDDIGMAALAGPMAGRARAVLAAGCDIAVHGSGDFAEMAAIADGCGAIAAAAAARLAAAMAWAQPGSKRTLAPLLAQRDALLAA